MSVCEATSAKRCCVTENLLCMWFHIYTHTYLQNISEKERKYLVFEVRLELINSRNAKCPLSRQHCSGTLAIFL